MDEIDIRRGNVIDAAQIVFDAHRVAGAAEDVAAHVEELLMLAEALMTRGLGRCMGRMRRSVGVCRTAAGQVASGAERMSGLLGDYVADVGRPATTSSAIHGRFDRARTTHDDAFDALMGQAAWAGRLAAGLSSLYGPATDDPLWGAAVDFLARLPPTDVAETVDVADETTLKVFLTGLAVHVGQHLPQFAVIQVAGTGRFIQFMMRAEDGEIQSVGDGVLPRAERLRKSDIGLLRDRGFRPPDDECPNWSLDLDVLSASRIGTLAAETLTTVHRFDPATGSLEVTVDEPDDHEDEPYDPEPRLLAGTTATELAAALAERVRGRVDATGGDALVTITQYGDHLAWSGHLHVADGVVVSSELRPTAHLSPQRRRALREAGWQLEGADLELEIVRRPGGDTDLDEACAAIVGALVDALDLDPEHGVAGVVVTYDADVGHPQVQPGSRAHVE